MAGVPLVAVAPSTRTVVHALTRSDLIWACWLVLFLLLEIPAACGWVPWLTLSGTAQLNEKLHPFLRLALAGFLIGLAVHIGWDVLLWRATLGGCLVASVLYLIW